MHGFSDYREMLQLPFAWDSGGCLSPFVASSRDDLRLLAKHLLRRYPTGFAMVDLGCGDGTALCHLADYVSETSPQAALNTRFLGVDIDEDLVALGQRDIQNRSGPPAIELQVADIAKDGVDLSGVQVLFVYLLPEALLTLRAVMEAAAAIVDVVVSNRWDVPYLIPQPMRVGTFHLYDMRGTSTHSAVDDDTE